MKKKALLVIMLCIVLLFAKNGITAEEEQPKGEAKQQTPPPALVEVAPVTQGEAEPKVEFVGTVYFARKSDVAAEVDGIRTWIEQNADKAGEAPYDHPWAGSVYSYTFDGIREGIAQAPK